MSAVEFSFNWFYADDRDIAFFSSGRLPLRAPGTDPALPTSGTGDSDWRGFLPFAGHARAINPPSGLILNWNNKPAADVGSADSNFAYGSVHRVELLRDTLGTKRKFSLAGVTGTMNAAATQDLRAMEVWPAIRAVLRTGTAPSARAEAAVSLVDAWRGVGASRLDRDLDGKIDDPGAAVLDAAWPLIGDAVMSPVLGPLVDRLARLMGRSNDAGPGGSAYISGWYGYVDKDLRALLDQPVRGPYSRRYCGAGVLATCREALWRALDTAAAELEKTQGPAPSAWRADATQRAHSLHVRRPRGDDALDEPADLPAGHLLLGAPTPLRDAVSRTAVGARLASPSAVRKIGIHSRGSDRAETRGGRSGRCASTSPRRPCTCERFAAPRALGSRAMRRKRYLMAPGPTPVPPEVLAAGAEPVLHHRGPDFRELMLRVLGRLQEVCRTQNDVLVFTASGSGAFESAIVNLLSPGERVLAVSAGEFGERWAATAAAYGADVQELRYSWGETPRPEDLRAPHRGDRGRGRVPRPFRDVDRCRRGRPGARARRRVKPVRSRWWTPSRASARCRSRPTRGASTSSSPGRRRR